MSRSFTILLYLFLWSLGISALRADSPKIIVFGDSINDVGNAYLAGVVNLTPPSYTVGKYTDGTDTTPKSSVSGLWIEQLATLLGYPVPLPSHSGGGDYAFSGATTGSGGGSTPGLGTQVNQFLASNPTPPSSSIYVIWCGANDLLDVSTPSALTAAEANAISNLKARIGQLAAAGATKFIWANLPPMGSTPKGLSSGYSAQLQVASAQFANDWAQAIPQLEASYPGITITGVDAYSLFREMIASPSAYGLTNVTSPAQGKSVNPDTYLFWDTVHPTTAADTIIAHLALEDLQSTASAQTITFNPIPSHLTTDSPFALSATASSGLSVTFSVISGPATVQGQTLTLTGQTGTVVVQANQAGNATYQAAPSVNQSFNVNSPSLKTATVTLGSLAATYDGTAKAVTATTSPAGLSVTFTYNGSATPPTNAGSYTVAGTVNDPNYQGSATGTLVIAKATATVTLANLAATYSGSLQTVTATTNPPGLSGSITYNGSTIAPANVGSYTVVGTISDPNYQGSATGTLVISKGTATVTLGSLAAAYNGGAQAATATTNPAGLSVTFTYNGSATAPTNVGSYTVVGTITNPNYQGSATGTLVISKGTAAVTLGSLAASYTGGAKTVTATTVPAGLAVTFTYNGSASAPTLIGSYTVVGTINNASYQGSAIGTLVISTGTATVTLGSLAATYSNTPKAATASTSPAGLNVTFTYNGSTTPPTASGSYTVVGTVNNANYVGSTTGTLVIAQARATVSLGSLAATYDGTAKAVTATTSPAGLSVDVTYNGSSVPPTTAGSYTVVGTVNDSNYQGSVTGMLVIAKAKATVTLANLAATYNGSPQSPTPTTNPAGLTGSMTYNGSATVPTNVGSYTVIGTISDPNYVGSATGTLVISKATATVTLANLAATYNGTSQAATATTNPAGLTTTFTYNGSTAIPVAAGSYTVVGTVNNANYVGSATGTLVISKGTPTITLGNLAAGYTGAAKTATATTVPAGLAVMFTYNGSTTAPTLIGSYTVVGTVNNANYVGSAAGTLVISTGTATVTLGSLAATYSNTPKAATATTSPASLSVNLTYDGSSTAPTAAGSYTVVGTVNNANYQGSTTGTLVISKARATVTLTNLTATYDGTAKSAGGITNPPGLSGTLTYNGSSTAPVNVGNYTVVGTITDANYQGSATGTLVISKTKATVTLTNLTAVYDGTAKGAGGTTNPPGLNGTLTYNGSSTAPTNVGSYTVVGTITDPNYQGSATGTLVISKATATVALGNLAFTYNGKAQAATATTTPAGLAVNFTYNGSTSIPVTAGTYTVIGTVNNTNYEGTGTGALVISKATAAVTLGSLAAVYTSGAHAATATTVPAGLAVTFTYNGSATAPILVGSYTVVGTVNNADYVGSATNTLVISPVPPLATTSAASLVSASTATLNGITNPKGASTTVFFQYGPTTTYGTATSSQVVNSGTANVTFSSTISGLNPQMPYHYRAVATNAAGTVYGADNTLTTLGEPVIAASSTAYLGASGAEVSESVNPNGVATTVYFQYGITTGYGSQTAAQSIGSGNVAVNVYGLFPELEPNTVYHYQMVTTSAAGTFYGLDQTFTTLPFATTLVVQEGDSVPGVSGATFASFGNPAVNVNDDVAFTGTLATNATAGVTTTNNIGIWAEDNTNASSLIARIGSTLAPGTAGATFLTLSNPVYNNNEAVAFQGTLKLVTGQATSTTAAGVWSTSSGSLALVARQGSQAPGCPAGATFNTFTSLGLSDSGGAVILATLNTNTAAGVTGANNVGIWEGNTSDDLALVLRLGDTVGGKTITQLTFLPLETYVNGQTRGFASTSGGIVCGATLSDNITHAVNTGIVQVVGGTPQITVLSGSAAAGVTNGVTSGTFSLFGSPSINSQGYIAFEAALTAGPGGVTLSSNAGIWADDNTGARRLIARTGIGTAPGTTATFLILSDPVYNNNEAVAFRGTLLTSTTGIWCNSTGSLALVAQQGSQAAGCPEGATFSAFNELALADQGGATNQGGVILLATLNANTTAGVGATNNLGIWAVDTTGTLQLIVRTGDTLNGKTVTGLAFLPALSYVNGQGRSFAQGTGDLVYLATFSDNSTAIFNVVFP